MRELEAAQALLRERLDDHFHDACGVFGVHGHPEASNITYLGLYALQHRGQESCGIVSSNGREHHVHRAMGLVADVWSDGTMLSACCAAGLAGLASWVLLEARLGRS